MRRDRIRIPKRKKVLAHSLSSPRTGAQYLADDPHPPPSLSPFCFSLHFRLMHRAVCGCIREPKSISIRMSSSRSRSRSRSKATSLGAAAAAGGGGATPQGGVDELVERAEEAASGASDTFEAPRCSKGMAKALRKPTKALAIVIGFRRDEMLIHSDVGELSRACREAKCAAVCVAAEGVDEGLDDLAGFAREQRKAEGKFPGPCVVMSRASTVRGIAMAASAGANIHPVHRGCFAFALPSKHHLEHQFFTRTTIVRIDTFKTLKPRCYEINPPPINPKPCNILDPQNLDTGTSNPEAQTVECRGDCCLRASWR
jgi:hypothetical protein